MDYSIARLRKKLNGECSSKLVASHLFHFVSLRSPLVESGILIWLGVMFGWGERNAGVFHWVCIVEGHKRQHRFWGDKEKGLPKAGRAS